MTAPVSCALLGWLAVNEPLARRGPAALAAMLPGLAVDDPYHRFSIRRVRAIWLAGFAPATGWATSAIWLASWRVLVTSGNAPALTGIRQTRILDTVDQFDGGGVR
jgi:hypothetical protein